MAPNRDEVSDASTCDLSAWVDDPGPDRPRIQRRERVTVPGLRRNAGHYGPCPERACRAYVSPRHSEHHRIHSLGGEGGAYAISDAVLRRLGSIGVGRVFIYETDTSSVYEYRLDQFTEHGHAVPERFLIDSRDTQTWQRASAAWAVWGDYPEEEFYIPRDEPLDPDEFEPDSGWFA